MRISGWLPGVLGFIILIALTAVCSFVSYGFTRQAVVDMWDNGLQVSSPGDFVGEVINPGGIDLGLTATPADAGGPLVLPSPTLEQAATAVVQAPTLAPETTTENDPAAESTSVPATEPVSDAAAATPTNTPPAGLEGVGQWTDPRQIRVLVMGIDQRSAVEEKGPFRTDTMILVNIDPIRKTAGVLSIPRDLWVDIPDVGQGRINQAHRQGDLIAYPGPDPQTSGGPALAMSTVANNFGVRVDRFVVVNFDLFERLVPVVAPQGVEVCPPERIYDPDFPDAGYGFIEVEFPAGCQRLDSIRLLQYARTRASDGGDFDRAKRQQEVLEAIRREVLSLGGITNFLTQIPNLWTQLSDSYNTNLSLTDIINLGYLMNDIDRENIRYAVVGPAYVTLGKSPTGDDILLPNWGAISSLVESTLYPGREQDSSTLLQTYQTENAPVYVYNGTDVSGLAGRTREWLLGRGVSVTDVGNDANHGGAPSEIRIYAADSRQYRGTAEYLATLLDMSMETITLGADGLIAEGVMVVAGPDMQQKINR